MHWTKRSTAKKGVMVFNLLLKGRKSQMDFQGAWEHFIVNWDERHRRLQI